MALSLFLVTCGLALLIEQQGIKRGQHWGDMSKIKIDQFPFHLSDQPCDLYELSKSILNWRNVFEYLKNLIDFV